MIILKNIKKKFGNQIALDDISFSIEKGEIFGFLGPSGSGKSTTINLLTGQLKQDSGEAQVLGKDTNNISSDDLLNFGIMTDTIGFYERLSIYKNLLFFAKFHNVSVDYLDQLLKDLDLFKDKNKTIKY